MEISIRFPDGMVLFSDLLLYTSHTPTGKWKYACCARIMLNLSYKAIVKEYGVPKFQLKKTLWKIYPLFKLNCCCCCCCYRPPVREVCPNYKVVVFQPQKLTIPDLGSVTYYYVAYLLDPPHPLLLPSAVLPPHPPPSVLVPHGIIHPPGRHPYPYHHN